MSSKIVSVPLKNGARKAAKLIDMKGASLDDAEHKAWLDSIIGQANKMSNPRFSVIGYSSTRGSSDSNKILSKDRAYAVNDYLKSRDPFFNPVIEILYMGEESFERRDPTKELDDMDPNWRAVEVQLFGEHRPPPKPDETPGPATKYPGASSKWAASVPIVFDINPMANSIPVKLALGFIVFKKLDQDKQRAVYAFGQAGFSLSLSTLMKWVKHLGPQNKSGDFNPDVARLTAALKKAIESGTFKNFVDFALQISSKGDPFSELSVENAFRHHDLNGATYESTAHGVVKSTNVHGQLPTFNHHGKVVNFDDKTFYKKNGWNFTVVTASGFASDPLQLDVALIKGMGGPLLRLGWAN